MKKSNNRKPFILGMIATTTVTSLVSWANVTNIPGFNIFTSGGVISSSQMNQNFDLINQKIDNIGAVTYVGTYDASVGVDPGAASAGDYYIISSGGIINSTNYVVGDWIVYNGTTWEQVQQGGLKVNKAGDTMTGDLTIDTNLRLKGGTNYVTVRASAATANYTLSLPTSAGTAGYVLQTDGAGVLSWVNPSSVTTGTGTVNSASITDATIVDADINASANIAQSKIAGLTITLSGKENIITAGATSQYYRGDKTWSPFGTDVVNSVLTSFTVGIGTKPAVTTTDSIVNAFGKVQKTLNDINSDYVSKTSDQTLNGTLAINSLTGFITVPTPINPTDAANKTYVDSTTTAMINTQATQAPLAGFTNGPVATVTSADTILVGMGKLQGQISDVLTGNAGNQWIQSSGNIYRNSGSVAIGTSTPNDKLVVANGGVRANSFAFNNNSGPAYFSSEFGMPIVFSATNNPSSNQQLTLTNLGKVGIGISSPAYDLHVMGTVAGTSAFVTASDKRLKENIHTVENALDKIHQLRGVRYHFTKESQEKLKNSSREELGVIAQEVKKVFPQAVSRDTNGMLSVAYSMLISPLIEAVKELDKKVSVENKALKEENTAIKNYLCDKDPHAPFCSN